MPAGKTDGRRGECVTRQIALTALLLTQRVERREEVCRRVGRYTSEVASATRRLLADSYDLALHGLLVGEDEGALAAARPALPVELGERVYAAAQSVGAGFVFADSLRLAAHKLTGRALGPLLGEWTAVVASPLARRAVMAFDKALTREVRLIRRGDGQARVFDPQAIVLGGGRVQLAGVCGDDWFCELAEDLDLDADQWRCGRREARAVPAAVLRPATRFTHVATRRTRELPAEALSYYWTAAALLASGAVGTLAELVEAIGGSEAEARAGLTALSCAQADGEFIAYVEVDADGRIEFEGEALAEVLDEPWPLTPREVRASVAALMLAGDSETAAALEDASGFRANVIVAPGVADADGQMALCEAA